MAIANTKGQFKMKFKFVIKMFTVVHLTGEQNESRLFNSIRVLLLPGILKVRLRQ